ncbi:Uncharacterised protein [Edwardsiella tarda]|nr:Uncharacterised protein [Edwardsiella tarda]
MGPGVVQQRTQLGDGDGDVGLHGVGAEEVIKQAADRALLEGGAAHVAGRTEGIFALLHVVKQRLGQWWQDGVDVLVGTLADLGGDISRRTQRVLEEANIHAQITQANVQGGVGVGEGIQRQQLVECADLGAQIQAVTVPIKHHPGQLGVVTHQIQQIVDRGAFHDVETPLAQLRIQLVQRDALEGRRRVTQK